MIDSARAETTETASSTSATRTVVSSLVLIVTLALAIGVAFRVPTPLEANDISRWCTVWSLLERGTYIIDECPWQDRTQDKVRRADPFFTPSQPGEPPPLHFYSSKPPFLPTLIAGLLYPFRALSGVPLDAFVFQERAPRYVPKPNPDSPGKPGYALETPEPVKWPVLLFYFEPVILLLNVAPLGLMLRRITRWLDRQASDDGSWLTSLFAAGLGTQLLVFCSILNNHTIAAFAVFLAIDALLTIWNSDEPSAMTFASAGFWASFAACNEMPALALGGVIFLFLLWRRPGLTLRAFLPAALLPGVFFLATLYLATGHFIPIYAEWGTQSYEYEGSYWNTPLEFDWFDKHPEPTWLYVFHMLFGHHGLFSLNPILLFGVLGALRAVRGRDGGLKLLAGLATGMTAMLATAYAWKTHNYGGSTQGMRWLFWVIPLWLLLVPVGLNRLWSRPWARWLILTALFFSCLSVGYGFRNPWSHPWLLDAMEHFGLYTLVR